MSSAHDHDPAQVDSNRSALDPYASPGIAADVPTEEASILSEHYRTPLITALVTQVIVSLIATLMLDGGRIAKMCGVALLAHWIIIGLILVRRPREGTAVDFLLIEWGFLPLAVGIVVLMTCLSGWLIR